MNFQELYGLDEIKNEIEPAAFEELEKQLKAIPDDEICKCKDCVQDMACYALNQIRPRYAVSLLGAIYTRAETEEHNDDIQEIIKKAINKISQNPFHSKS